MKISTYIADLLFEHECIVIPGLGGFISSNISASIDEHTNNFNPPGKNIVFNVHLQLNDGLLLNYVANRENIPHKEARIKLENFVNKCHEALNQGKRIHFRKIGCLKNDENGYISFEADTNYNYDANAYGLSNFISPVIKRDAGIRLSKKHKDRRQEQQQPREEIKEQETASLEKKHKYLTINFFWVIIVLAVIGVSYLKFDLIRNFYNNNAQSIPFFYSLPGEYIAANFADNSMLQKIIPDNAAPVNNPNNPVKQTSKTGFGFSFNDFTSEDPEDTSQEMDNTKNNSPNETKMDTNTEDDSNEGYIYTPENQDRTIKDKEELIEEPPVKDKISDDYDSGIADNEITDKEQTDSYIPEETYTETPAKTPNNSQTAVEISNMKYFLIAGSFMNLQNAENLVSDLNSQGYEAAVIGTNKYGDHRVCYQGYTSRYDAEKDLAYIRKSLNPSAWLFIKN